MRRPLALAIAVIAATAHADKRGKPATIDISAARARLDVYRDTGGNYYVSPHRHDGELDAEKRLVFFGDGKTMYQQQIIGVGSDEHGFDWSLWSPRVVGMQQAQLALDADPPSIVCKLHEDRPLTQLPADQAEHVLDTATFRPALWNRTPAVLARDEDGVYYYVDRLDDDHGGKDFRAYVGRKGAMKQQTLVDVASDTAGQVFSTRAGDLRLTTEASAQTAQWRKGTSRTALTMLPMLENRYLIYRELGIYGALGVVCDDQ